jgi:hypothetical protein
LRPFSPLVGVPGASCHSASETVTMIGTEPARKPAPPTVPWVSPAGTGLGGVVARLNVEIQPLTLSAGPPAME